MNLYLITIFALCCVAFGLLCMLAAWLLDRRSNDVVRREVERARLDAALWPMRLDIDDEVREEPNHG